MISKVRLFAEGFMLCLTICSVAMCFYLIKNHDEIGYTEQARANLAVLADTLK